MQNAERKRHDGTPSHPSIAGPFRRTVDETRRPARVHHHILLPSSKPQKKSLLDKDFYAQTRDAKNSTPSPMRTTKRVKNDKNTHTKICMIELLRRLCLWSICTFLVVRWFWFLSRRVFVRGGRCDTFPKGAKLKGLYTHVRVLSRFEVKRPFF